MSMMKNLLILLLLLFSAVGWGDTHVAASASYADVAAAIALADSGDTVIVPADGGAATWDSVLTITKAIIFQGPGKSNLTITSNVGSSEHLWEYSPATGTTTPFRVTGFTFDLNNNSSAFLLSNSGSQYPITNVRIDNNSFLNCINTLGDTVRVTGPVWGVIDNNVFTGTIVMDMYGRNSCDDWLYQDQELGTANCMYLEDNDITSDYLVVTSGGQGGAYVFRHNTVSYTHETQQFWPFDIHGNQTDVVGTRFTEIYENTVTSTNGLNINFFDHRGGKAVIFNNSFYGGSSCFFTAREEFCNSINCGGIYDMTVKESYYWNNYENDIPVSNSDLSTSNNCGEYTMLENENFWIHDTAFDGSSGMGVGTLASRPNSGLTVGVGYWATDENKLYRATGATTWEEYYTPYTYPHPGRGGGDDENIIRVTRGGLIDPTWFGLLSLFTEKTLFWVVLFFAINSATFVAVVYIYYKYGRRK